MCGYLKIKQRYKKKSNYPGKYKNSDVCCKGTNKKLAMTTAAQTAAQMIPKGPMPTDLNLWKNITWSNKE